jgi:hypothetical protein
MIAVEVGRNRNTWFTMSVAVLIRMLHRVPDTLDHGGFLVTILKK